MAAFLWWISLAGFVLWAIAPVLARLGAIPPMWGFSLWALAGLVLGACLILVIFFGLRMGWTSVIWLLPFTGLPVLVLGVSMVRNWDAPPINDISTDLSKPPEIRLSGNGGENWKVASPPGENVARRQLSAYPEVQPLRLPASSEAVFARAVDCARKRTDWEIVMVEEESKRIFGTARTAWFRFPDDFTIEVNSAPNGSSVVQMRSRSRHGVSDLGKNAARITHFLGELQEKF